MKPYENHQDANRIPNGSAVRVVEFKSLEQKAKWLDAAASLDSLRRGVHDIAQRFLRISDAEARARAMQRWVRDHVHYERDYRVSQNSPGEEFADTTTTVARGYGDCDDKSRAFVAIVRAAEMLHPVGLQARIRPIFTKHPLLQFVHVQVEVRWPRSELSDRAQPGGWLLAEMILKGAEIGDDPDDVPRGPHGERMLA